MIELFYWPTPNGKKVTILLEECGIDYKVTPVNIQQGAQFTDDFLRLNPNHRMPAIVDHKPADGAAPIGIFESGAIMMYIAEKTGRFWPQDMRTKYEVTQWLIWQMANQGPRVDVFDADHALGFHVVPDRGDRFPMARQRAELSGHEPGHVGLF